MSARKISGEVVNEHMTFENGARRFIKRELSRLRVRGKIIASVDCGIYFLAKFKIRFAMISISSPTTRPDWSFYFKMSSHGVVPDSGARSNGVVVFYALSVVYEKPGNDTVCLYLSCMYIAFSWTCTTAHHVEVRLQLLETLLASGDNIINKNIAPNFWNDRQLSHTL